MSTPRTNELLQRILTRDGQVGVVNAPEEWVTLARELEGKLAIARVALEDISQGSGVFSADPLQHAANCIEKAVRVATEALAAIAP